MKKILTKVAVLALSSLPFMAMGQGGTQGGKNILNLVTDLGNIVKALVPIVFALGVLGFFWGLVLYIFAQGNEENKKSAKGIMLWALVALFVMASVWGIIGLAQTTLGVQSTTAPTIPVITTPTINIGR